MLFAVFLVRYSSGYILKVSVVSDNTFVFFLFFFEVDPVLTVYRKGYIQQLKIPNWISLASLALTGFLIISFIVLPAKDTKRNFLSLGLLFFVLFIAVGL